MQTLLELDFYWRVLAVCSIPILFAIVLHWVTQHSPIAGFFQRYVGVVSTIFSSVAILFALFAAFLAADTWDRVEASHRSLENEAGAIQGLQQIARTQGSDATAIEVSLTHYIKTSLSQEWASEQKGRSEAVDNALERLVTAILDPALSSDAHRNAQAAMLESYRDIRHARAERIHVADSTSDPHKWGAVILLGLLTQVAIAMVHFENRRAQAAGVTIFTIAFVITLSMLVAHESPLADIAVISPESIHNLVR